MKYIIYIVSIFFLFGCVNQNLLDAKQNLLNVKSSIKASHMALKVSKNDSSTEKDMMFSVSHDMNIVTCLSLALSKNNLKKISKEDLNKEDLENYILIKNEIEDIEKNISLDCKKIINDDI